MDDTDVLTGSTDLHLMDINAGCPDKPAMLVHSQVVEPLARLRAMAADGGFDLTVCSGFRSFARQMHIWNGKLSGLRPVIDESGKPVDLAALDPWQQIQAVLRWSALPGASRHHWGTDLDIYDAAAMPEGYQLRLTPDEAEGQGLFAPMHNWLDGCLASSSEVEFYRPYAQDRGGVAPERWHISYRPVADNYSSQLTDTVVAERLQGSGLLLLDVVLDHLDEILQRYVCVD